MDHQFYIVHVTIRGLRSNLANLNAYLEKIQFPDVVTLNETKLNINQPISIPNYDCVARKERHGCQHGSLILKCKDISDVTIIKDFERFHEEVIGIRLNGNTRRPSINVITYYNPPNSFVNSDILQSCRRLNGRTVITGDFNCKNVSWGSTKSDNQGRALFTNINDCQFYILNNGEKTRYDPQSGKEQVLDLCLTNGEFINDFVSWIVRPDIGSDHFPINTTFSLRGGGRGQGSFRNIKTADWSNFQTSLNNVDLLLPTPKTADELDSAVALITAKILEAFDQACPLQQKRHKTKTTFTKEMISLVKEKRRQRRLKAESRRRDDEQMVRAFQQEINRKNHELKKLQKIQRRRRIRNMCEELNAEKDSARFFRLFDEIRDKEPHSKVYCDIKDGNDTASSDKEKADLFAKRLERLHQTASDTAFSSTWKELVESYIGAREDAFQVNATSEYSAYETGDDNFLLQQITSDEICEQLKKCKNKSAPGEDGLNYLILKKLPENAMKYLQLLFNTSLKLGYFPSNWKTATIKLTPKSRKDNKEAKNWRPISLISVLAKIFERIIASRLSSFLEANNHLSSS